MRIKWFLHASACALIISSVSSVADAKPKRPAATSAAKKKAAAAAAAAKKEANRLAAEAAARAAAEAAEKARIRAQWGIFADIGDADFEMADVPVTFRRIGQGNAIEITSWSSMGRTVSRVTRDPASGALSYAPPKGETIALSALPDGTIEARDSKDVRWPFAKRRSSGEIEMMGRPGSVGTIKPIGGSSKAASKLAKLVGAGKVNSLGTPVTVATAAPQRSLGNPVGGASAVPVMAPEETFAHLQSHEGYWSNGEMMWVISRQGERVKVESYLETKPNGSWDYRLENGQLYAGDLPMWVVPGGYYYPYGKWALTFQSDGSFDIAVGKRDKITGNFVATGNKSYTPIDGHYSRKTAEEARTWIGFVNARVAERAREKASGGNSGWLGGLLMGGMAAAAGGDAGMVMGAAMKGVEMTTDNEMSRAVLAGEGDKMMQSSIETQRQIAETERLRQAAADETRRKREAATTGSTSATAKTASVAPLASASVAVPVAATPKPAASASGEVRYSFCTDTRTDRSSGKVREVIYYSRIGTIRPGPNGGINFPTGFADFVDTKSNLARHPMSENCPLFESVARAEQDLAIKRQIERPGIRDFIYLPDFMPR